MKLEPDKAAYSVCNLLRLSHLPGGYVTSDDNELSYSSPMPFDVFVAQLVELCEAHDMTQGDNWARWSANHVPKCAVILVVTTDLQPASNEYLERLGFASSGPFEKIKHQNSKLIVWTMHAPAFCEAIGYVSKYDPRTKEVACAA